MFERATLALHFCLNKTQLESEDGNLVQDREYLGLKTLTKEFDIYHPTKRLVGSP